MHGPSSEGGNPYPGDRHLFADDSLPAYDEKAAALAMERVLSFLDTIE